jgi:hypothetical protein
MISLINATNRKIHHFVTGETVTLVKIQSHRDGQHGTFYTVIVEDETGRRYEAEPLQFGENDLDEQARQSLYG